jgi:hypothetical protein
VLPSVRAKLEKECPTLKVSITVPNKLVMVLPISLLCIDAASSLIYLTHPIMLRI